MPESTAKSGRISIKKYANRRLYNTATSSYVTLDYLAGMVKENIDFVVVDAKSGDDITRAVLTQIIVEEENKNGQNLLPISFLRQLIGFYGDNMQWVVPRYLDASMQALAANQDRMRDYFKNSIETMGGPMTSILPFTKVFDEMGKQNIAMFERTLRMFSGLSEHQREGEADGPTSTADDPRAQLAQLQNQLAALEARLVKAPSKDEQ